MHWVPHKIIVSVYTVIYLKDSIHGSNNEIFIKERGVIISN